MELAYVKQLGQRKKADVLVLPFWRDKHGVPVMDPLAKELSPLLAGLLATKDFTGKEEEVVFLYVDGEVEKRIALVGLGNQDKVTVESLRRCYGSLAKSCLAKHIKSLNVLIPQNSQMDEESILRGAAEGLFLPNTIVSGLKHRDRGEQKESLLQKVTWIGPQRNVLKIVKEISLIFQGVEYTRHLVNGNADEVTPQFLAECAKSLANSHPAIKTTVFDKKRIIKEKLELLLAVNRGSALDPVFIMMEYRGNPRSKEHIVIVGKGITYDTGGLNLKPTGSMETMKCDMAGGAACFGILLAVCLLELKVNVTVVIPSTENSIDAKSFKPGDVYNSYAGKTVEMTNSDAEGRLVLADALAYAVNHLKPTCLIDIATLTGAIEIALGSEASGLMGNNQKLIQDLLQAGQSTFERLWHMPLFEEYKERLKSDIADLKSWNGRAAGANVAATFLRQFVGESIPWAHIDIAGTAYSADGKKYLPKYATGNGVRLLVEFLKNQSR